MGEEEARSPSEVIPRAAVMQATAMVWEIPGRDSSVSARAGPRKATVCSLCSQFETTENGKF